MIKVIFENEKCLIKGPIDLGYIGKYENLEYGDDCIEISSTLDEIIDEMNNPEYIEMSRTWNFLNRYVTDINADNIATAIENYFNAQEKVQKNISYINGQFLYNIYDMFECTTYPFWEIKEIVHWKLLPDIDNDEIEDVVYENCIDFDSIKDDYSNMEDLFRILLPTFNLETFFENVEPNGLA